MGYLAGKIFLVTGASRGIGASLARKLAFEGAHVILVARTVGGLEEVDDQIQTDNKAHSTGGQATLVPLDLRELDSIDGLAQQIAERYGKLDGLIANAATIGNLQPADTIETKVWNETFTVNVHANFRLLRAFSSLLKTSEQASVIGITAEQASSCAPFWGLIASTKAAFSALFTTYKNEVAHTDIYVEMIDPGDVATNWFSAANPGNTLENIKTADDAAADIMQSIASVYDKNSSNN